MLTECKQPKGDRRSLGCSKLGTTHAQRRHHPGHALPATRWATPHTADTKPGEVNGNDFSSFGAQWYALDPSGAEVGG